MKSAEKRNSQTPDYMYIVLSVINVFPNNERPSNVFHLKNTLFFYLQHSIFHQNYFLLHNFHMLNLSSSKGIILHYNVPYFWLRIHMYTYRQYSKYNF